MATTKTMILKWASALLFIIAITIALRWWRHHALYFLPDDVIVLAVLGAIFGVSVIVSRRRKRT